MSDILEDILQMRGIPVESPTVLESGTKVVAFMEKRIIYKISEGNSMIRFHAQAKLTQMPNYRLVNTLNKNTREGKFTIQEQKIYDFELSQAKADITNLEEFAQYAFRQAEIGYSILNTTSQDKRRKLLAEKKAEMKEAEAK